MASDTAISPPFSPLPKALERDSLLFMEEETSINYVEQYWQVFPFEF